MASLLRSSACLLFMCAGANFAHAASPPVRLVTPSAWHPNIGGFYQLDVFDHQWDVLNGEKPWSLSSPGPETVRFEIHDGDVYTWDRTAGAGSTRSEIATYYQRIPLRTPIHVTYGLTLEPGITNTADWLVLSQLHFEWDDPKTHKGGSPNVSICLDKASDVMTVNIGYTDASGKNVNGPIWKDTAPIIRGHRYRMELFMFVDPTGGGRLVALRDGVLLTDYHGTIGYVGEKNNYWKVGIYRPHGPKEVMASRIDHLALTWGDAVTMPKPSTQRPTPRALEQGSGLAVTKIEGPFGDGTRRATMQGRATPGTEVTFTRDGLGAGRTTADASGLFSYRFVVEKGSTHTIIASVAGKAAYAPPLTVSDADLR